jgi:hypothetical protein
MGFSEQETVGLKENLSADKVDHSDISIHFRNFERFFGVINEPQDFTGQIK